jgi:hypothetical protein
VALRHARHRQNLLVRGFAQRGDGAERLEERRACLGADAGDAVELRFEAAALANFGAAAIREPVRFVTRPR